MKPILEKPILEIEALTKYYGRGANRTKALDGITLQVMPGEFLGIMGSSGSGKSTLLNCIATVIHPDGGRISAEGISLQKLKGAELARYRGTKIGYLFQNFELLDNLTGRENILLPLSIHNIPEAEGEKRMGQLASYLEIQDILHKFPSQMSGGQKQRVAAARALVLNPGMVLADEPTGSVKLVQHYPKIIPVTFPALSTFISSMADRQRVRFSSRDKVSYIALKSAVKYFLTAAKSGGASCAGSGSCPSAAVYIS